MKKALRTTLSLVVSLVLLSTLTLAAPRAKNSDKSKSKEHHNPISKLAFWRHHKNTGKKAPANHAQAKSAQMKPSPAKPMVAKKDQKQQPSHMAKASNNKASATKKTKQQPKTQEHKTAS